jgi:hypothetical protein
VVAFLVKSGSDFRATQALMRAGPPAVPFQHRSRSDRHPTPHKIRLRPSPSPARGRCRNCAIDIRVSECPSGKEESPVPGTAPQDGRRKLGANTLKPDVSQWTRNSKFLPQNPAVARTAHDNDSRCVTLAAARREIARHPGPWQDAIFDDSGRYLAAVTAQVTCVLSWLRSNLASW